ncbi:hypothetical protein QLQ12_29495 [Actinoplanes sp. NEAU-A12]|uniref:DUF3558 domain-containing protein n=1 Tax=Actinoplanes sandaracinus TaxID=3045177 RepID=A0ABT6WSP4_9ACTN|nr:hypothetical protein [Actinoplanes sandaracinus]MDI6102762.1 hypothetical protein [Actinoplanes sandaracinus]
MRQRAILTVAALALTSGCGSTGMGLSPDPPWHAIPGCPTVGGHQRITEGPKADTKTVDTAEKYGLSCHYGTPDKVTLVISVMIDRTATDSAADHELSDQAARKAGMLVLPLSGTGDRAMIIVDPAGKLQPNTTVHAETVSRNTIAYAQLYGLTPVRTDADANVHAPALATALNETLKILRPA